MVWIRCLYNKECHMHRDEDLTVFTSVLAAYDPATLVPLDAYIDVSPAPTCWINVGAYAPTALGSGGTNT